ncbi:MAG TPA: tetratricopeptide repeat protein [Candidatus Polarisedimenticolia bacterium]|jgi:tetratricopeptide (TPR) repeat protein|nr:tetratricopeptide repeat protein [Candidatus Polarisedimenticolia bacterium]
MSASASSRGALGRARAALQLRRYRDAAREAALAMAANPANPDAHALLAQACLGLDRHVDARKAAEAGLAIDPESEWLHRLRSISLRLCGQPKGALAAADEAVRLAPWNASAHHVRADALRVLGRTDDAHASIRRALELDPRNPETLRVMGDFSLESDPKTAELYYRDSLKLDPRDADTLNNLGVALNKQKRRHEAAIAFKSALLLNPESAIAKRNAHSTIKGLVKVLPGAGIGAFWVTKVMWAVLVVRSILGPGLIIAVAVAMFLIGRSLYHRWRLRRADPQLLEIYRRLETDKRAGRL